MIINEELSYLTKTSVCVMVEKKDIFRIKSFKTVILPPYFLRKL